MKLSALKGKEQKVRITVPSNEEGTPDEEVEVVYRPGVLTIDVFERVSELQKGGGDVGIVAELLSNVLVSWDLEDEDADGNTRPLGVTKDEIRQVPIPFLGQIMEEITKAVTPTPPRGGTSDEVSPQEDTRVPSLSGTS